MKKRFLALALCFSLVLTLLAGCGSVELATHFDESLVDLVESLTDIAAQVALVRAECVETRGSISSSGMAESVRRAAHR